LIINKKAQDAKIEKLININTLEALKALKEPEEPLMFTINKDAITIYNLKAPSKQKLY
jgi:hypothetical protein